MLNYSREDAIDAVPPGWANIVARCYDDLNAVVPHATVEQVKEKFGGLRFYVDFDLSDRKAFDKVISIVGDYYNQSIKTCQRCAAPGELLTIGTLWITVCLQHKFVVEQERMAKFFDNPA